MANKNVCECVYFKDILKNDPVYVQSTKWSNKKHQRLRSKKSSTSIIKVKPVKPIGNDDTSEEPNELLKLLNDIF
ncbi:MAG: hypothetical protein U9Q66_02260 [Patescibacteria group bacterium]|nr:hypothetical protein [Patescibacteria group bacterium]